MTTDPIDPAIVEKAARRLMSDLECEVRRRRKTYTDYVCNLHTEEAPEGICSLVLHHVTSVLEAAAPLIAAKALREAAEAVRIYAWQPGDGSPPPKGHAAAYMHGADDAHNVCDRLLRARADALEAGQS